jgi:hypothetical protein
MEITITLTDASGALLTGKAAYTELIVRRVSDGFILDFNDLNFKSTGWTSIYSQFLEIDATNLPGQYKKDIDITGWVNGDYKYIAKFDDGISLENFTGEIYVDGSVVAVPAITPVSGVGGDILRARIATHLNRTDLTTHIGTFCDLAVRELETNCLWFQLTSATVLTVASQGYAALPLGFIKEVKDGFRDTSGTPLVKTDWATLDYWQTYSGGTDEPDYYAIADKIYFYSIPNAVYSLPMQYYRRLGFPSAGFDNSWTDEVWDLTFWTALKHAWIYLRNIEEQGKCEKEIVKCLARYRKHSGKMTGKGSVTYREF